MNKLVPATGLALAISTPVTAQDNPTAKAVFVNLAGAKIGTAIYVARRAGCLRSDGLPAGEWVPTACGATTLPVPTSAFRKWQSYSR
jgi:hypothetical protein